MKVNMQPHLKLKTEDVSEIVLLPGDPARVLAIAKYLKGAREIAQNREFLTYRGFYKNIDVTVTSTGIGCPSAAIAVEELANVGVKTFIRVGTCGAVKKGIDSGDLIIPTFALREEGTTKEYVGPKFVAKPSQDVFEALVKAAQKVKTRYFNGKNRTHDAFYEPLANFLRFKDVRGLISSEMECAAVFVVAKLRGLKAGAEKTPQAVYELSSEKKAQKGVAKAIKVALEAVTLLAD